jgi:hypothetical protein
LSTLGTPGNPDPRSHIERGALVGETQIERIEREQREAKEREEKYTQAQVALNKQQLNVNFWLMAFTGLLFLTSVLSGIASQTSADASAAAVDLQDILMRRNRITEARQEWLQARALQENQRQFKETSDSNNEQFRKTLHQMTLQTIAQGNAATASANAASVAQTALEVGQRPWLAVVAEITKFEWSGPAELAAVRFGYRLKVKNFGNLPASSVYIFYDTNPLPGFPSHPEPLKAVVKEVNDFCEASIAAGDFAKRAFQSSQTIMPTEEKAFPEKDYARSASLAVWKQWQQPPSIDAFYYPRGCVIYSTPTVKGMRHTGFLYELGRKGHLELAGYPDAINEVELRDYSGETTSN